MKLNLPFFGPVFIGRNAEVKEIVKEVQKAKEKGTLGGTVDLFAQGGSLVTETKASDKLLKANDGWVYKNNDVIAKEVGTIEFELFSTRVVGDEIVFNPIITHPILDSLDRFNEFTAASDGFYLTESHVNLAGDAFWYVNGRGPNVKGLYLLQPDKVTLTLGDPIDGQYVIQSYEFQDTVNGKTIQKTYKREEIIHFKNPNPDNPYRGKSKVQAAAEAIDTDNYAIEANKGLFKRGLITNFVLSTENKLNTEQLTALRAELNNVYGGSKNAYKAMILSGGLKPESIQMTNKDMEFIAQQKWLRDKIMSIFGNNQAVLGITEDVNRANAESTILNWKRTTVKSEMKAITDTLNEFFVPRFGENLILTFKDPVPEDRATKVTEAKDLVDAKIITQNEAREILGLDPVKDEGADELNRPMPEINPLENAPKSIFNVNYKKVLRKNKTYEKYVQHSEIRKAAKAVATKMVKGRKKEAPTVQAEVVAEHEAFDNDTVWNFHNKQIQIVDAQEKIFENKVKQYIDGLVERALAQIPNELPQAKNKALLNEEAEIIQATIDFTPILNEVALLSGQSALALIGSDKPFISPDLRPVIERNVRKFAQSMIETDREKMIDIIAQGVANGESVAKIRKNITDTFEEYSKVQANRVTRTEVLRASNTGAIQAWQESDVVVAKQWLTAKDDRVDPLCEYMNGTIIPLSKSYFKRGESLTVGDHTAKFNYGSVKEPPLHPNCRCTLLPVLVDQKAFDAENYLNLRMIDKLNKDLESQKVKLEAKLDKRTKEYRDLKEKNLDLESHIKELKKLIPDESIETE